MVVPDPSNPVGHPARPGQARIRDVFQIRLDPGRKLLPNAGAALFDKCGKPLVDAVEVRLSGQTAYLLRRPPAIAAAVGLFCGAQNLALRKPPLRCVLNDPAGVMKQTEPNPGKIDRIFAKAVDRRTRGRAGLYMQSRFPNEDWENGVTAAPYSVFEGFTELFENFESWLARTTSCRVHGHLFGKDKAHFARGEECINGALCGSAAIRDYNPKAFLTNLIWNTRGEHQCFQFGPDDDQKINWRLAKDPNAQISVISGAWAVPLFRSNMNFLDIRKEAARLQKIENKHIQVLRSPYSKARVRVWTMAEFIEAPMEPLQTILDEIGPAKEHRVSEVPKMADLQGFGQFLQNLKNQGMHPHLMGDFAVAQGAEHPVKKSGKPYLVR